MNVFTKRTIYLNEIYQNDKRKRNDIKEFKLTIEIKLELNNPKIRIKIDQLPKDKRVNWKKNQGTGIKGKEMALVWHEKASRTTA